MQTHNAFKMSQRDHDVCKETLTCLQQVMEARQGILGHLPSSRHWEWAALPDLLQR